MDKVENVAVSAYSPELAPGAGLEGRRSGPRAVQRYSKPRPRYASFDIFQWLPEESQYAFTLASRRRHYPDGCRIYSQTESADEMFRVVCGTVRMSVLREDGREVLYQVLEPGDCFGVCSLLARTPRHHTTTASGDTVVQILRRDACDRLRSRDPSFAEALIRQVARHMLVLSDYFVSSTLDELSCRLAQRLLQGQTGAVSERGTSTTVRLGQGELALMVGASRQAVNRVLQRFQDEGLISIEYGRVQVHDAEGLRKVQ
ncbi:MAG TPA: Crp/Fnr family transcriptional regulator [Steroidobacteraceae bacterium]|jgi:CRP/FNR family transcriptional regulator